jgi:hypothetical protein
VIASVLEADHAIGQNISDTTPLMGRIFDDWCSPQPVEDHESLNWKVIRLYECMPLSYSPSLSGWLLKIRMSDVVVLQRGC